MGASHVGPFGRYRPRAQYGAGHAGAVQLLVNRFGKGLYERFGCRVDGHAGYRLKSSDRGDVEHGARTTVDHPREGRMGEFHERQRVDNDLLALTLHPQAVERPTGAEAGAVAQTGDWCATDAVYELRACRPVGKETCCTAAARST